MSDTPRTEKAWEKMVHSGNRSAMKGECAKLERELASMTEERDILRDRFRQLMPFVLEDYYPNCATPEFKNAVEDAKDVLKWT